MEMTESEIVSILKQKIDRGLNEAGGEISENRLENYERYIGRGYGTERDGYSSVVTREAMETVEWALPSIMRVFTTSSSVVRYAPVGPEDEGEAQQQTDVANYYLTKENNSFLLGCSQCSTMTTPLKFPCVIILIASSVRFPSDPR